MYYVAHWQMIGHKGLSPFAGRLCGMGIPGSCLQLLGCRLMSQAERSV